jgi:hypothetical protein
MSWCRAHSGTCDRILLPVGRLLFLSWGLVSVGRPLWREDGSAVCSVITLWSELHETRNHPLLSQLRFPKPGSRSHVTTDGQSVCQDIETTLGLPTRYYFLSEGCFLKVAEVWGLKSRQDWWSVSQYVLASSPPRDLRPDINSVWILLCCLCWAPSLTRGRVCLLSVTVSNNYPSSSFI